MRTFAAVLIAATLAAAGGYAWHRADVAATARAEWLQDNPIAVTDDADSSIVLFPSGLLKRSVRVIAFASGSEDTLTEDEFADRISHTKAAKEFYDLGFRTVVSGSSIPREIVITPQSAVQTEELGELSARSN